MLLWNDDNTAISALGGHWPWVYQSHKGDATVPGRAVRKGQGGREESQRAGPGAPDYRVEL